MGYVESDQHFLFLSTILLLLQLMAQYCDLIAAQAQPSSYVYHLCLGGNYSTNTDSVYQTDLKILLHSLSSFHIRLGIGKGYYYNHTVRYNLETVYGAVQCRTDLISETICSDCVDRAAKQIVDRCPNSKEAIMWYDDCMLRYSGESFFSIMQERPSFYLINSKKIPSADQFNQKLASLMDGLVRDAVIDSSSSNTSLFATGQISFTEFQKIYGLVQCTFDLSNSSCRRCLLGAIIELPRCCDGKQGGRVIRPSCYFRYEIYPFYESKVTPAASTTKAKQTNSSNIAAKGTNSSKIVIIIVAPTVITILSTMMVWYFCLRRRKGTKQIDDVNEIQSAESLKFNFNAIRVSTDNFSDANKLGQGGFGPVYKGTLPDGLEIAVKRLSRNSGQGEKEFKNEVALVMKIQHKNLVRLLGFCIDGEEKLLVYEYMANASLDQFIFDPIKRKYLDWEKRYKIIVGIARGLLYLHEDSRLMIIHRDLKASNVLLGSGLNPKISDFGMARMFMVDQTQAMTDRIVGTYGYMAPEYAMHGQFSVKSDVFSFGVVVLEILSGKRINSFYESEGTENLLSYAWRHWKEGTTLELLDPTLREHHSRIEVMICINIGLLCVQEGVADRPTMASVVNKLNNYSVNLKSPLPPPAFFVHNRQEDTIPLRESKYLTVNEASITELYPR